MKLSTGIIALAITMGTAWAQNPATILENTKNSLQGVEQQKTAASNAALQGSAAPAKPSPGITARPGTASSQPAAKPAPVPVKAAAKPGAAPSQATLKTVSAPASSTVRVVPAKAATAKTSPAPAVKPAMKAASAPAATAQGKLDPTKAVPTRVAAAKEKTTTAPAKPAAGGTQAAKPDKQEEKKYSMTGKRDPFLSPVVSRQMSSGCSTGKKCLDIEQIALHGVVKSDNGMIAVVTNALNKAYFLRENDPVFNGYVVKITVDSIVFKQNFQDRLGKPFTKDVVKRITTPAV